MCTKLEAVKGEGSSWVDEEILSSNIKGVNSLSE